MITTVALVAAALLVASQGAVSLPSQVPPSPSFRFAYNDGSQPEGGVAQFYKGPTSAFIYNWGYQFPGRSHSEIKTYDGRVQGSYAFVDANGEVQQATYRADPTSGFTVEQIPVARVAVQQHVFPDPVAAGAVPIPVAYDQQQELFSTLAEKGIGLGTGSKRAIEAASPILLAALRSGFLMPLSSTDNELVFRVSDRLVNDARGSVSSLAALLDADPVAARHDQQVVRPAGTFYSGAPSNNLSANRAILETAYLEDGPAYIIRVPYEN